MKANMDGGRRRTGRNKEQMQEKARSNIFYVPAKIFYFILFSF
jgi:hypothetical protein